MPSSYFWRGVLKAFDPIFYCSKISLGSGTNTFGKTNGVWTQLYNMLS